tara:strand:- start:235 stop:762 length:528 start_codon:yes stop_codon:yes gene_type:complete
MRKLKNNELNRIDLKEFKEKNKTPIIIVLDNIRSAYNVGSIFRTSDAFLLSGIYLCGITPKPPHKEIRKTALGANESVDWKYFKNTSESIKDLKSKNYTIISIEQVKKGENLNNFTPKKEKKYALIFGNEIKGVSQEIVDLSDKCIEIPQYGTKHSLNVGISVGIIVWDFFQKMK